ncbi:GRB10-interacting GYF protein 2-like [Magallana gigas]|uniref:GRB10-interacting GYF protein 2-like n=1 Tax=Magallana gigas TaxID=29159 RepID=UPI003340F009
MHSTIHINRKIERTMPRLGVFVVLIVCALACAVDSRRLMVQRGYYDEPLFRTSYREPSVYLRRSTFGLGRSSNSLRPQRIQSGRILDLGFPETRQRNSLPSLFNDRNNGQLARTSSREVLGNSPRILDLGFPETRQRNSLPSLFNDRNNGQLARTSSREVLGNSPRILDLGFPETRQRNSLPSLFNDRNNGQLARTSSREVLGNSPRILDLGFPETRQRNSLPSLFNDRNGQLARTSSREVLGNSPRTSQHHQSARLLQGLRRVQEPRRNMASVLDTLRQRQAIPSSREVLGSSVFGHSQRALQPNHRERQLTRMIQVQEPRKVIAKVSISRKAASGKSSKEVIGQAVPVFAEQPAQSADMGKIIDIIQEQRKQQNKLLEQRQKQLQKQQELVHKSLQKQQEELQKMLQQQQQQVKLTSKEVMGLW